MSACVHAVEAGKFPPWHGLFVDAVKGWGKDTLAALGLNHTLLFSPRPLLLEAAADDFDQAKELHGAMADDIRVNAWKGEWLTLQTRRIVNTKTGAECRFLAKDEHGSHGSRPNGITVCNELSHVQSRGFVSTVLDIASNGQSTKMATLIGRPRRSTFSHTRKSHWGLHPRIMIKTTNPNIFTRNPSPRGKTMSSERIVTYNLKIVADKGNQGSLKAFHKQMVSAFAKVDRAATQTWASIDKTVKKSADRQITEIQRVAKESAKIHATTIKSHAKSHATLSKQARGTADASIAEARRAGKAAEKAIESRLKVGELASRQEIRTGVSISQSKLQEMDRADRKANQDRRAQEREAKRASTRLANDTIRKNKAIACRN